MIRKDALGTPHIIKKSFIAVGGIATYAGLAYINRLQFEGAEHIKDLPSKNVLLISNHQTYYKDVMAFYHIFCAIQSGCTSRLPLLPIHLLTPPAHVYYVAAEETMTKKGIIPRLLMLGGALTVRRSWRQGDEAVKREVDHEGIDSIKQALQQGWVISFPQGTTKPNAPVRKGTAHLIRELQPVVLPIVIDGFSRAFTKDGLVFKEPGTRLSVRFKEPLRFDSDASSEAILKSIEEGIELESL